jgi:hypothetical protein
MSEEVPPVAIGPVDDGRRLDLDEADDLAGYSDGLTDGLSSANPTGNP